MGKKIVIAIGRGKGSGGHYIGELLASRLGIKCYDSEILYETAKRSGFAKEFMEEYEEKKPASFLYSLVTGSTGTYIQPLQQQLYLAQANAIKEIAQKESAVFVGRCSNYVLREFPELLSVFVYAPLEDCVKRVKRTVSIPDGEAEMLILRTNKSRSEYYRHFTDEKWGDARNYHLSVNSSDVAVDGAVDLILEYLKIREKYQKS